GLEVEHLHDRYSAVNDEVSMNGALRIWRLVVVNRVGAGCTYAAIRQPSCAGQSYAREARIPSEIPRSIGPISSPSGAHAHDGAWSGKPPLLEPPVEVLRINAIVGFQ